MHNYQIILQQTNDNWWIAFTPDFPGANSQGKTKAEALENIADAIKLLRESYVEDFTQNTNRYETTNLQLAFA